jgi:hypothetical protein
VYYRGEAQLSGGQATITLPDYFEALTKPEGRTVLLTPRFEDTSPISMLAASAIEDGKFRVRATDKKNPDQPFYWEVKAERSIEDSFDVEPAKEASHEKPADAASRRASSRVRAGRRRTGGASGAGGAMP